MRIASPRRYACNRLKRKSHNNLCCTALAPSFLLDAANDGRRGFCREGRKRVRAARSFSATISRTGAARKQPNRRTFQSDLLISQGFFLVTSQYAWAAVKPTVDRSAWIAG